MSIYEFPKYVAYQIGGKKFSDFLVYKYGVAQHQLAGIFSSVQSISNAITALTSNTSSLEIKFR